MVPALTLALRRVCPGVVVLPAFALIPVFAPAPTTVPWM